MAMVLEVFHRPLRPSSQKPLEDCYGFPPPPSALRQTAMAISTKFLPQMPASPSPSPSTASPSPTPSLHPTHRHHYPMCDAEPQIIECGSNLADYLAKNPGMKRLYNNHGSIKRPACVSCNESRKKCDLERPCTRCVKQKLPCIERPPRAKRRKIEHEFPIIPPPPQCPPSLDIFHYGLPSPASEPQSETIVSTPMELDIEPVSVVHSVDERPPRALCSTPLSPPDCSEIGVCGEQAIGTSDAGTYNHQDVADIEVPSPMGSYLDGISSMLSGAPVFGLEGSDSTLKGILLEELERDLSLESENMDVLGASSLLWSADGMAKDNEGMNSALQGMDVDVFSEEMNFDLQDVDALMEYPPTDQEIKDILGWQGFDLEMTDAQIDGMDGLSTYADAPGANFSTAADTFDWNDDWSI